LVTRRPLPLMLLRCRDSGIGLTSSDMDLLFVPFQQADNSVSGFVQTTKKTS
jgi:hypothetical protein